MNMAGPRWTSTILPSVVLTLRCTLTVPSALATLTAPVTTRAIVVSAVG
jgi:hypothetical protein